MRRTGVAAALVTALASIAPAADASDPVRLEGRWKVSLRFVVAVGLRDRAVGQRVSETWFFRPRCRQGACTVELRRAGRSLLLRRSAIGYHGARSFRGAFVCNGQTDATGTTYTETWTVRVRTSAAGPRGRRALMIAGVGETTGVSASSLPCAGVKSRERVQLRGALIRR